NEPVSGFTAGDVSFTGSTAGGTLTAVVTEIAPLDGTTYDVAVSGMTSSGTVVASIGAGGASDAAGNTNAASTSADNTVTYTVPAGTTFVFYGFFAPIDNLPVLNMAKAGQSIPVKWRLTDEFGNPIFDPASFTSLTSMGVSCTTYAGVSGDYIETYVGSSGLQYIGSGYWQFNWQTLKGYANTCREMKLTLSDGQSFTALFKFNK
ncbi:MAG TPA: PxKF domain-containing protein, partial [Mycobacterium sp.]